MGPNMLKWRLHLLENPVLALADPQLGRLMAITDALKAAGALRCQTVQLEDNLQTTSNGHQLGEKIRCHSSTLGLNVYGSCMLCVKYHIKVIRNTFDIVHGEPTPHDLVNVSRHLRLDRLLHQYLLTLLYFHPATSLFCFTVEKSHLYYYHLYEVTTL